MVQESGDSAITLTLLRFPESLKDHSLNHCRILLGKLYQLWIEYWRQ